MSIVESVQIFYLQILIQINNFKVFLWRQVFKNYTFQTFLLNLNTLLLIINTTTAQLPFHNIQIHLHHHHQQQHYKTNSTMVGFSQFYYCYHHHHHPCIILSNSELRIHRKVSYCEINLRQWAPRQLAQKLKIKL